MQWRILKVGVAGKREGKSVRLRSITAWLAAGMIALSLSAIPSLAQGRREEEPPRRAERQAHPPAGSRGAAREAMQQNRAGEWLRQHRNMTPEQQRRALENDPRFRNLPPQQQQRYREQLDRFNRLPPDQQDRVLNRMQTWERLSPEQKEQVRQFHQQMQQLPPGRQQAVRNAIQSLRAMPPEARQRMIESPDFQSHFSPQERDMLDKASRLPLAPAEPNEQGPEE